MLNSLQPEGGVRKHTATEGTILLQAPIALEDSPEKVGFVSQGIEINRKEESLEKNHRRERSFMHPNEMNSAIL